MSHGSHLKQMLYGAAAIFAVLVIAGMPVGTALTYGLFLACPLMMVWMMMSMNGQDHGHGSGDRNAADAGHRADDAWDSEHVDSTRRDAR